MGCLVALPLAALTMGMSALMGLFTGVATFMVTSMVGFIAFLLILI